MKIIHKREISEPLRNPKGEVIYEMIGGNAFKHSVAHIILPPGGSSQPHYHLVSEESYVMLRGQAQLLINGKTIQLEPGHTCLIQPHEVHQISNLSDHEEIEFIAICTPPWVIEDSIFISEPQ